MNILNAVKRGQY